MNSRAMLILDLRLEDSTSSALISALVLACIIYCNLPAGRVDPAWNVILGHFRACEMGFPPQQALDLFEQVATLAKLVRGPSE